MPDISFFKPSNNGNPGVLLACTFLAPLSIFFLYSGFKKMGSGDNNKICEGTIMFLAGCVYFGLACNLFAKLWAESCQSGLTPRM